METSWETDKTDKQGYEPNPNICVCVLPKVNNDLLVKTKGKLKKYKCGVCLSWNLRGKDNV